MSEGLGRLGRRQRELLTCWVPDASVVADHSWGLVDDVVLEVSSAQGLLIVKAGGPSDRHIGREIRAHQEWLGPWVRTGHAPALLRADEDARLLVTRYLPGVLVEGTSAQGDPGVYRQAGELLARFHGQLSVWDAHWNEAFRTRVKRHLDLPHRIVPGIEQKVRVEVESWPGGGATVVPTHGDWQPRNWLTDDGIVRVIDFGRADLRPPTEDFVRLTRQDFARHPGLEEAFFEGYGDDPRQSGPWRRALLGEAVGTAVWAYGVGDADFERFGHDLLRRMYPLQQTR